MRKLLSVLILFLAFSCTQRKEAIHLEGNAQGSTFSITYYDSLNRDFSHEVDSVLRLMEAVASNWDKNSLIQQFNKADTLITINDSTGHFKHLIEQAYHLYFASDSVFDVSIYPLLKHYGYAPEKDTIAPEALKDLVNLSTIYFLFNGNSITLNKKPGQAIDFNAYAKGYTVDVLANLFEENGIQSYLIELGGELKAGAKKPNGNLWTVGIDKPVQSNEHNLLQTVSIENRALATSGNYRKFKIVDGKKVSHTFNALTKEPCITDILSCTVLAPTAETADAYATIFMIWGGNKTKQFLSTTEANDLAIDAILVFSGDSTNYHIYSSLEK